jgi:Na+/proline symporter
MNMFPVVSQEFGYFFIAMYAVFVFALTSWYASGYDKTKEAYLVANRQVGFVQGSMSVGASWIQSGGIFVAAQQAYVNGLTGLFWFSLGNFFSLILFSFGATKLKRKYGSTGFTVSQWFRDNYGTLPQYIIMFMTLLYAIQGMTISLFTSSKSVNMVTGISPLVVSILLVAIAFTYSLRGGLKATIITDIVKIFIIWLGVGFVGFMIYNSVGIQPALDGIGGKTGQGTTLFDNSFAIGVFFGFGFTTAMGHLSQTWVDNSNYQNAFSMKAENVRATYLLAPFYWTILPIIGGFIGLTAAGLHYDVKGPDTGFINLIVMAKEVGWWLPVVYLFVVLGTIVSLIDTELLTSANVTANDVMQVTNGNDDLSWSKYGMLILAVCGITIANIPGLDLSQIFIVGKLLAATLFAPMLLAILFDNYTTKQGFITGSVLSFFIGCPLFLYGQFFGGGQYVIFAASVFQIFGAGLICLIVSYFTRKEVTQ